jgi:hypothetical protein
VLRLRWRPGHDLPLNPPDRARLLLGVSARRTTCGRREENEEHARAMRARHRTHRGRRACSCIRDRERIRRMGSAPVCAAPASATMRRSIRPSRASPETTRCGRPLSRATALAARHPTGLSGTACPRCDAAALELAIGLGLDCRTRARLQVAARRGGTRGRPSARPPPGHPQTARPWTRTRGGTSRRAPCRRRCSQAPPHASSRRSGPSAAAAQAAGDSRLLWRHALQQRPGRGRLGGACSKPARIQALLLLQAAHTKVALLPGATLARP